MKKLRIGWVGSGFIGQLAHLEHFSKFPNVEIVALAEKRQKLLHSVGTSFGIKNLYSDHLDLISEEKCDAIVAIVNRRHTFKVAYDILSSGNHLLTEKPMAQTYDDAIKLVALAKARHLKYCAGFMRRYDLGVRKVKDFLNNANDRKDFGKILSVRLYVEAGSDYCGIQERISTPEAKIPAPPHKIAPNWLRSELHNDYESFVNVCSHDINILTFLFDEIPEVKFVEYKKDAVSYAFMDYGDFSGVFEWSFYKDALSGSREGLQIRFENGDLELKLPPAFLRNVSSEIKIRKFASQNVLEMEEKIIKSDYVWSFANSDRAFVDSLLSGDVPDHTGEKVVNDFKLIDAIWNRI